MKLVSMLLMLVVMEVVHISMEEMTMTVMLLAMLCSYVGSGSRGLYLSQKHNF